MSGRPRDRSRKRSLVGALDDRLVLLHKRRPCNHRLETCDGTLIPATSGATPSSRVPRTARDARGAPRTENTHPFRYRQWLFACSTGSAESCPPSSLRGRLTEQLPQFHRDAAGETDSEARFTSSSRSSTTRGPVDRPAVELRRPASTARCAARSAWSIASARRASPPTASDSSSPTRTSPSSPRTPARRWATASSGAATSSGSSATAASAACASPTTRTAG